ncbi:MAG: hypothetical protein H6Q04_1524 [Acidobacteria bacterium]|nr:hypothetical protein [Acidobacteriota bacterium]
MPKANMQDIASSKRHSRFYFKTAVVLVAVAAIAHLFLGARVVVVLLGVAITLLSLLPIVYFGVFNLAAILIALLGIRYAGFPIFAKLFMGQPLDLFLIDPIGSFAVVLVGILSYLGAFWTASKCSIGRPLLHQTLDQAVLARISILAAAVGIAANLAMALRAGEEYSGITIAEFFASFLHLALIAGIARAIVASNRRSGVDSFVIVIVIAELVFGMVRNSRVTLIETLLCFVITVSAFEYKIRWRSFGMVYIFMVMMVIFITPVFLYVRSFHGQLSWTARIAATMDAAVNWPDTFSYFLQYRDKRDQLGWYLNYYGSHQNVFERLSLVNHVDVLKSGVDAWQTVGFEDLSMSLERVMPRALAPNKPRDFSQGYWLYSGIGIQYPGPFATSPLIGTGYAAFSWIGSFLYPFVLGFAWILIIKKMTGWELHNNVWVIYMLLRIQNQFVEGSSDAYLIYILRSLPQDFIILWILNAVGRWHIINSWPKIPMIQN